jgi:HEAT repeat protein
MSQDHASERFAVIQAGFTGDVDAAVDALLHPDHTVRASALRSLQRLNALTETQVVAALTDSSSEVRRTGIEVSVLMHSLHIHPLLNDDDVFVAEMAAWCLGERTSPTDNEIEALMAATLHHAEPVVREASAAALGSLGDSRGLPAILTACNDKPAVRRRAVLALAPFEGEEVDAALEKALEDRDWQVRQNAEILLNPRD